MKPIPNPFRTPGCFFCGDQNPAGLKLSFFESDAEPREIILNWHVSPIFKGFGTVLHGGIQSGIFDEIMGWATTHLAKGTGVTTDLQVKFLRPVYVDQDIEARCRIASREGNKVSLEAEISQAGEVCTRCSGVYLILEPDRFHDLIKDA
jgi:acyl-coenzyme A thioesterase PaaI-like protein